MAGAATQAVFGLAALLMLAAAAQSQKAGEASYGTLFSRARFGGRPFGHFGRRLQPSQANPPPPRAAISEEQPPKEEVTTTSALFSTAEVTVRPSARAATATRGSRAPASAAPTARSAAVSQAPRVVKPVEKAGVGRSDALRGVETGSFVVGGSENYVEKTFEIKSGKQSGKINTESKLTAVTSTSTQQESVQEGETAIIHCSFEDIPLAGGQLQTQIWWTKMPSRAHDKPLVMAAGVQTRIPDERLKVVSFPEHLFSILIIRNAVLEDSAEYKCSLPTVTGYRTIFTRLDVRESLANQIESSDPQNAVRSGDDLRLFCRAKAGRPVSTWWSAKTSDGKTISLAGSDDKVWGESLVVPGITKDMEGVYTCYVEGAEGSVVKKHFSVSVKEKPWTIAAYRQGLKADAHLSKMDRHVAYGETVNLRCDSGGVPKPKITWFRQGSIIVASDNVKYSVTVYEPAYKPNALVSKLAIANFSAADAGRYTCVVENDMGLREHTFDIRGSENLSKDVAELPEFL